MTLALAALSHAPSFGNVDPGGSIFQEIQAAIVEVQDFVTDFNPDVVIAIGPDHFNGVLYSMMPPFAIGAQAEGIGDYGTLAGPVPVDSEAARKLHALMLEKKIDVARSEKLKIDHGLMQPMEFVFGHGFKQPFVPIFMNALGLPLTPMSRVREFGEALGQSALELNQRVLILASGGISHNPPIPRWDGAPGTMQERLIQYSPSREEREEREQKIINGIQAIADGKRSSEPLNQEWDELLLNTFRSGNMTDVDQWANDWFIAEGGSAAHEMRTWIAAFSALGMQGDYKMDVDHYWAVPTWGAGFGICAASGVGA